MVVFFPEFLNGRCKCSIGYFKDCNTISTLFCNCKEFPKFSKLTVEATTALDDLFQFQKMPFAYPKQ
jgi:hypothetical protein